MSFILSLIYPLISGTYSRCNRWNGTSTIGGYSSGAKLCLLFKRLNILHDLFLELNTEKHWTAKQHNSSSFAYVAARCKPAPCAHHHRGIEANLRQGNCHVIKNGMRTSPILNQFKMQSYAVLSRGICYGNHSNSRIHWAVVSCCWQCFLDSFSCKAMPGCCQEQGLWSFKYPELGHTNKNSLSKAA